MRSVAILAAAAFIASADVGHAGGLQFTTIDNSADPTFNQLLGINNTGTISGYFGSGAAGHPNQGYTIAAPYTTFVPANLPDSTQTQATGINAAGVVTGFWSPTNNGPGMDANYGFIRMKDRKNFVYLDVNDPNAGGSPVTVQVLGINSSNVAVGFYVDAGAVSHGFAYNVANGGYKTINVKGAAATAATGINNGGLVSGSFTTAKGTTEGFLMPLGGGLTQKFRVPGSANTQVLGVNNVGVAVGFYVDRNMVSHGIFFTPSNFNWTQVDDPDAGTVAGTGTTLNGLNDKGQMVGFYTDANGNTHGMLVTGAVMPAH